MALDSMQEIFDKIQAGRKPFWQVVRDTDVEERQVTAEASFEKMHATWRAMVESVDTYRADRRSVSGLVGGDAQRMWDYAAQQETLCGPYLQEVIATALCVAESNACMGDVGRRLPVELRETALGGLAATPFGQSVKAKREERRSQEQEL